MFFMAYIDKIKDIYEMISARKLLEAFDKYYGEEVSMVDVGHGPAVVGKAANRAREVAFVEMIEEYHGMELGAITSDEKAGITIIENSMDVTLKGIGRVHYTQIAVQKWEGDFIVEEKFYHK